MPYSNDMVDALLGAFATGSSLGRRHVILKGRSVGKTAMMQAAVQHAPPQPITFAQLEAAYQRAMKSNPNPYGPTTATGPTFQRQHSQLDLKSGIDIIIRREVLPACVKDVPGTDEFDLWTWHGFEETLASGPSGYITARHIKKNTHHQRRFYFSRSVLDDYLNTNDASALFSLIDAEMMQTVEAIVVNSLPPHDINTCTDPECNC